MIKPAYDQNSKTGWYYFPLNFCHRDERVDSSDLIPDTLLHSIDDTALIAVTEVLWQWVTIT